MKDYDGDLSKFSVRILFNNNMANGLRLLFNCRLIGFFSCSKLLKIKRLMFI